MGEQALNREEIGAAFHRLTKQGLEDKRVFNAWADALVTARRLESASGSVPLPNPQTEGGPGLWSTVRSRHSTRIYSPRPVTPGEVSQLLWAGQGRLHGRLTKGLRTTPSAGARYPIETRLAINRVEGIEPGIYQWDSAENALRPVRVGDVREPLAIVASSQAMCANAPLTLAWIAIVGRTTVRCGQRGYRYLYIEAGHIAQNVALAAEALGLGSCQVGGFLDDAVNRLFETDPEAAPVIYMTSIGAPREPS